MDSFQLMGLILPNARSLELVLTLYLSIIHSVPPMESTVLLTVPNVLAKISAPLIKLQPLVPMAEQMEFANSSLVLPLADYENVQML